MIVSSFDRSEGSGKTRGGGCAELMSREDPTKDQADPMTAEDLGGQRHRGRHRCDHRGRSPAKFVFKRNHQDAWCRANCRGKKKGDEGDRSDDPSVVERVEREARKPALRGASFHL